MPDYNFLHDIKTKPFRNSLGYKLILTSPLLGQQCLVKGWEVVRLYQARVGKKTGRLAASAEVWNRMGGRKNDRVIAAVTIADDSVASEWKGQPFYYGEYHEEGTLNSRRAKRRRADGPRRPRKGYHELREVANEWRQS